MPPRPANRSKRFAKGRPQPGIPSQEHELFYLHVLAHLQTLRRRRATESSAQPIQPPLYRALNFTPTFAHATEQFLLGASSPTEKDGGAPEPRPELAEGVSPLLRDLGAECNPCFPEAHLE